MTDKSIPIVVVDDTGSDRYIARRRLSRHARFDPVLEVETGERFLSAFFQPPVSEQVAGRRAVILMDINMPRLDGFETIEALQDRVAADGGPDSIVILMFTSSDNPEDRRRAAELPMVKGYIVKPLDDAGVAQIVRLYDAA